MELSFTNSIAFRMSYLKDCQPVPWSYEDWGWEPKPIPFFPEWRLEKREGFSYGFGLQWRGLAIDLGFGYLLYSFPTSDWKISLAYKK